MAELLTSEQLAEKLHVSVYTIRRYTYQGIIPHLKLGARRLYILDEVIEALRGRDDGER